MECEHVFMESFLGDDLSMWSRCGTCGRDFKVDDSAPSLVDEPVGGIVPGDNEYWCAEHQEVDACIEPMPTMDMHKDTLSGTGPQIQNIKRPPHGATSLVYNIELRDLFAAHALEHTCQNAFMMLQIDTQQQGYKPSNDRASEVLSKACNNAWVIADIMIAIREDSRDKVEVRKADAV